MKRHIRHRLQRFLRAHGGVITRQEAIRLGASGAEIRNLVATGEWERAARGVYVVAALAPTALRRHAVVLAAAGEGAMLSHASAAWLWDLVEAAPEVVTVTVRGERRPHPAKARVYRAAVVPPPVTRRGLPCTDPLRTLIDLAAGASPKVVDAAVDRAVAQGLTSLAALDQATRSGRGMPRPQPPGQPPNQRKSGRGPRGVRRLRRALEDRGMLGGPAPSVLESKTARLFRAYRIRGFVAELAWFDGAYRFDFADPSRRLAVEVDGYAFHRSPEHARHDHQRHNDLTADGWTFLVYTWRDVLYRPRDVATAVLAAQARLPPRPSWPPKPEPRPS